jgi:predicted ATPase
MSKDRITELRIEGLRTIERLTLSLGGLTVLIGENGSGKSSILEACEILRRAAGPEFFNELHSVHGGMFSLLRHDAAELRLGVTVDGAGEPLRYDMSLSREGSGTIVSRELLRLGTLEGDAAPLELIQRTRDSSQVYQPDGLRAIPQARASQLVLGSTGIFSPHPGITRMQKALEEIETHLPFEVLPAWAAQAYKRKSAMRGTMLLQPVDRLADLGENLANAFHTLRTEYPLAHWQTTMDYVRLGLGDHIESVNDRSDPGGGAIALWLKLRGREQQIPSSALADGELAYLAFVALYRLPDARSLLTFDEPELHLHPGLLVRVLGLFESMAGSHPVLLATHSDRLLDVLEKPAEAVRVCEIEGEDRKTRLRELDPHALEQWLAEYHGVGHIRSEGYLSMILGPEEPA